MPDRLHQGKLIVNYINLIEELKKVLKLDEILLASDLDRLGVCHGLCIVFEQKSQDNKLEQFYNFMNYLSKANNPSKIAAEYAKARNEDRRLKEESRARIARGEAAGEYGTHFYLTTDGCEPIRFDEFMTFIDLIADAQTKNLPHALGMSWDQTYTFTCHDRFLVEHLKNAGLDQTNSRFFNIVIGAHDAAHHPDDHMFMIEKRPDGYVVLEPNNITRRIFKNLTELADEINHNIEEGYKGQIGKFPLGLSIMFISDNDEMNERIRRTVTDLVEKRNLDLSLLSFMKSFLKRQLSLADLALTIQRFIDDKSNKNIPIELKSLYERELKAFLEENNIIGKQRESFIIGDPRPIDRQLDRLRLAVVHQQEFMVNHLLSNLGPPLETYNNYKDVIKAAEIGNLAMFDLLLSHLQEPTKYLNTELDPVTLLWAVQQKDINTVKLLIKYQYSLESKSPGNTQILLSLVNQKQNVEEFLRKKFNGVLPDSIPDVTPLFLAIAMENKVAVQLLIKGGANIHTEVSGISYQELAKVINDKEIGDLLIPNKQEFLLFHHQPTETMEKPNTPTAEPKKPS